MSLDDAPTVDWPAIFREIDRDVTAWTPESLRADVCETRLRRGPRRDRPRHDRAPARGHLGDLRAHQRPSTSTSRRSPRRRRGASRASTSSRNPTLTRFLDLVFVGQHYGRESAAARRIMGGKPQKDWQPPLVAPRRQLLPRVLVHGELLGAVRRVRRRRAGPPAPAHQLPGDAALRRASPRKPVHQFRDGTENSQYFPSDALSVDRLRQDFGDDCLFRPAMKPGDVIIASNWIVHGSYQTAEHDQGPRQHGDSIHRHLPRHRGEAGCVRSLSHRGLVSSPTASSPSCGSRRGPGFHSGRNGCEG